MRKTQGVKNLVEEAWASLPTPHTEDVILALSLSASLLNGVFSGVVLE